VESNIIVKTADGSNTIYNAEVGENYHSRNGALQESRHVFLKSGLLYFLEKSSQTKTTSEVKVFPPTGGGDLPAGQAGLEGADAHSVSILEVGFGTGLNFLLSADYCTEKEINLEYTGIEAYPLSMDMISQTGYDQYISEEIWKKFIKNYEELLLSPVKLNHYCQLQIANRKLLKFQSKQQYNIIYFDAFASARQPEMWNEAAINYTIQFLKPGGVFVTYAITGNLKRALKALGCKVEKALGAPGKREMLRAVKIV
jgi:tRNA U34 5-methylaminomethyl-2-thiouridine-forming methyltransferase MnmC